MRSTKRSTVPQESVVPETSLPGDGRLDEVAGHVQLVAPLQVVNS